MVNTIRQRDRKRMTGGEFRSALQVVGLDPEAFAWISGADSRRVARWLSGDEPDIPAWVPLVCGLLKLDGGPETALKITRVMTGKARV